MLLLGIFAGTASAKDSYMTQSYIDSVIHMAFYGFHAAQEIPDAEFMMKRAIADAKDVIARFRRMARGNINEKYILWKVSELEAQVMLEERELVLKKMKQRHASANDLIERFNALLGAKRPDFSQLWLIHSQMARIDARKANEISWSANHRARNISRELLLSIQKALISNNLEKARAELSYCRKHKQHLLIPDATFANLETEVSDRVGAADRKAHLQRGLDKARASCKRNRLGETRKILNRCRSILSDIKPLITGTEWLKHNKTLNGLTRTLNQKEDSLVNANLIVLQKRGVDAGIDYLDRVIKKHNISPQKYKVIDDAIMAAAPDRRSKSDAKVARELSALSHSSIDMGLTLEAVKKEAKRRADSAAAVAAEKARILALEKAYQDSIAAVKRAKAEAQLRKKKDKARSYMMAIYDLLEKEKERKAMRHFKKRREYIKEYIDFPTFSMLESTVKRAYAERRDKKKKGKEKAAVALVAKTKKPPPKPQPSAARKQAEQQQEKATETIMTIYTMLETGNVDKAYDIFTRNEPQLTSAVSGEVLTMLKATVTQSRAALIEQRQRDAAKETMAQIYELLEQNRIKEAHAEFEQAREMIRQFAGDEPFTMLETIVREAYQYVQ